MHVAGEIGPSLFLSGASRDSFGRVHEGDAGHMLKNGTRSRESQSLIALLLLSLGTSVACGSAPAAEDSAAQTGGPAAAGPSTSAGAPSTGAAGRAATAAATTQAGSQPGTAMATTPRPAASAAGAAAAPTTGPAMAGAAGTAAAPTAGAAGATAAGPDETPSAAGAGGSATAAAAGASGGTASAAGASAEMPREDLGKGDGSDVITIGDSWMNLGATGIQQSLVRLSMQPYRTYGLAATRLLDEVIPRQYASAKRENPDIKTVVMTGGGNDILLTGAGADRSTAGPATRGQIDMIADRLVMLWDEMGADGVKDVVYIEYSRGGGSEAAVNYATEKIKPLCDEFTATRCHWVDADDHLMMMLSLDGIHPTGDGCDKIATGVIAMMEKEGMRR